MSGFHLKISRRCSPVPNLPESAASNGRGQTPVHLYLPTGVSLLSPQPVAASLVEGHDV